MKREQWIELIQVGVSAVVGLLVVVAALVVGLAAVVWIEKAPEFFAVVIAAGMVSAALYFRKPYKIYNLTVGHPETGEIIDALKRLMEKPK